MTGLSAGILPSRLMRSTFPFRLARFCAFAALAASPIETHRRPNRSISTAQPLWVVLAAAPVRSTVGADHVARLGLSV